MSREFCVYNETRENLLAPRVTVIDPRSDPLKAVKVLIEGLAPNADAGLWLNPLKSVPAVPRLSGYDLVYLDREGGVVHGIELAPDDEVPPIEAPTASALLLPLHTFSASHVQPGDRVVMRPTAETQIPPLSAAALSAVTDSSPVSPVAARLWPLAWSSPSPALADTEPAPLPVPESIPQPARIQPPPVPAERRFQFLRTLARLRIQIQISITTVPASSPAPARPASRTALRFATQAMRSRLTDLGASTVAALRPRFAQCVALLRRQGHSWSATYLRWADAFVFHRADHISSPDQFPRIKRYVFDFMFPH